MHQSGRKGKLASCPESFPTILSLKGHSPVRLSIASALLSTISLEVPCQGTKRAMFSFTVISVYRLKSCMYPGILSRLTSVGAAQKGTFPSVRIGYPHRHPYQRSLAGPVRTDKSKYLSPAHFQIYIIKGGRCF